MDKHITESFKLHQTRRAMHRAVREARAALCIGPRVEQARTLTPQELDRFRQRRIVRDEARRFELGVVFGNKKKLPMPVFACENTSNQQVRPRVVSPIDAWVNEGGLS